MTQDAYTVAVVGGGPAGTTAAKAVADGDRDADVVLFDEGTKRADRDGVQGPDSTDAAGQLQYWLDEMPEWVRQIFLDNEVGRIEAAEFHAPNDTALIRRGDRFEQFVTTRFPASEPSFDLDGFGITFDRAGLDDDLLDATERAGVDVRVGSRVGGVETEWAGGRPQHVLTVPGGTDVTAEYLLLADGPKRRATMSAIGQFLDGEAERVHPANGNQHTARQFYVSPPADAEWTDGIEERFVFYWGHLPGHTAYPWVFPLEDGVFEIGLTRPTALDSPDAFDELAVDPADWPLLDAGDETYPGDVEILDRLYDRVLGGCGRLADHTVADRGKSGGRETYVISSMRPFDSPTRANVAIVGGAGGFTSAFHEGGDHLAVYTGSLAGSLIGSADRSLREYNREWKRRYGYEIYPNVAFADLIEGYEPEDYDRLFASLVGESKPTSVSQAAHVIDIVSRFGARRLAVGADLYLALEARLPDGVVDRLRDDVVGLEPPPIHESEYRFPDHDTP